MAKDPPCWLLTKTVGIPDSSLGEVLPPAQVIGNQVMVSTTPTGHNHHSLCVGLKRIKTRPVLDRFLDCCKEWSQNQVFVFDAVNKKGLKKFAPRCEKS